MISQLRLEHSSLGVAKVWIYEIFFNINICVDYSLKMFFSLLYVYCSLSFNHFASLCSLPSVTFSNFCSSSSMNNSSPFIVCYSDHKKLNTSRRPTACITSRIQSYMTYKWSNNRSMRIKVNTAGFETGIQGLNRQQLSYSWRIFRVIQSWTRHSITLRGTCRVDRKSRFVHLFWRLWLVEKLISASHDGIILLILSHRDKNRDLISVLLNWLLVLNVDLISDWSYRQLESFPSNRFRPISIFGHVIH